MTLKPVQPAWSRRRAAAALSTAAAWGLLGSAASLPARAQSPAPTWPTRPLRMVVAFPPGGLADVMMRVLQPGLQEALGQTVVIDNRGGAGGNVAGAEVVRNGADGHTLLVSVTTTESVNPSMFNPMPFDPRRDLRHVALLANSQLFLITRPDLPVGSAQELVRHLKANPGKLSYGSPGTGTTPHLAGEMFKRSTGTFATHIPYRGAAPAIQDVMAGQLDFMFAPGTVFPAVRAGKLKLFGVASRERTQNFPSAATMAELGVPGVYADTYFGIFAPTAVPAEGVARLNREINRLLAQPAIKQRFAELGADAMPLSTEQFRQLVADETRLFGDVIRSRGIRAE